MYSIYVSQEAILEKDIKLSFNISSVSDDLRNIQILQKSSLSLIVVVV